jgi:hypothetical protein
MCGSRSTALCRNIANKSRGLGQEDKEQNQKHESSLHNKFTFPIQFILSARRLAITVQGEHIHGDFLVCKDLLESYLYFLSLSSLNNNGWRKNGEVCP